MLHCPYERGIFEETSVIDGERDSWKVLVDDFSCADREVADFTASFFSPGESHRDA